MEGLASPFNAIKEVLDFIFSTISDGFTSIGEGLTDLFESCGEFFSNLLDWLNPFSENFFVYKLIELLGDLLYSLFVPSEERLSAIPNLVNSKFAFIDSIKVAINSFQEIINNLGTAPSIHVDIGATKYTSADNITVIDLNWYRPYKNYGDVVITGLFYAFYLWRLFNRLAGIINGTSGAGATIERISNIEGGKR